MDRFPFLTWTTRRGVRDGQTHLSQMDSKDRCEDGQAHSKGRCEGWTDSPSLHGQQGEVLGTDRHTFLRWTARIGVRMDRPTFLRWTARRGVRMDRPTAKAGARDGQIPLPYRDNKERC